MHLSSPPPTSTPLRICVVGVSGCGKSTLARALSQRLQIPYINNDQLLWMPHWQLRPKPEFAAMADAATQQPSWVFDGNLGSDLADQIVLSRANTVVWLDYPRHLILHRILRRTIRRVAFREKIFSGNVEGFRQSFLSRDSIILWSMTSYERLKKRYTALFDRLNGSAVHLIRQHSPRETDRWVRSTSCFIRRDESAAIPVC